MITQRRVRSCLLQGLLVLVWAAAPATPASSARSLSWSAGRVSGSPILIAVACPASNLCVAFSKKVFVSKDPGAGARSWKPVPGLQIPPNLLTMESINIYDVACPSTHLCLAGTGGQLVYTTNPLGGASAWHKLTLDTFGEIAAISCPSVHFCVALIQVPPTSGDSNGTGKVFFSTNPAGGRSAWKQGATLANDSLQGLSCPSAALCVAGGQGGVDWTTDVTNPLAAWQSQIDGPGVIDSVSCPSTKLCLAEPEGALDGYHDIVTTDPSSGNWRKTPVGTGFLTCASASLCVGVGYPGVAVWSSTNLTGGKPDWQLTRIRKTKHYQYLRAVSCPSNSFCVAVGDKGWVAVGAAKP